MGTDLKRDWKRLAYVGAAACGHGAVIAEINHAPVFRSEMPIFGCEKYRDWHNRNDTSVTVAFESAALSRGLPERKNRIHATCLQYTTSEGTGTSNSTRPSSDPSSCLGFPSQFASSNWM